VTTSSFRKTAASQSDSTGYGYAYLSRVLPFAVFALCTVASSLLDLPKGPSYAVKTLLTAGCLAWAWNGFKGEIRVTFSGEAVLAGVFVFFCWIGLDGLYPHAGQSAFNPYLEAPGHIVYLVMAVRILGAVLVVPLMEEVFWRSFALRFVLRKDFLALPLGSFSWYAFVLNVVLFGLEHHRWLAGILAGAVYALLLHRSKNLFIPILAHAVTNLLLAIYVVFSGNWSFW